MTFYQYRQNNSGGAFDFDKQRGISQHVIVEADTAADADDRAQKIGVYFDGCESGQDCSCCGDRWYEASSYNASEVPAIRGTPLEEATATMNWMEAEPSAFVHYADGRVVGWRLVETSETDKYGKPVLTFMEVK